MRVTSNTFSADLLNQLGYLSREQSRLQSQAATGQRVSLPEDDPGAASRVLDLQAEANAVAQYQRNINQAHGVSQNTYSAVQSLKKISDRASEIATMADSLRSPEEMTAYSAEITQLIRQAVQLVNTKSNGVYLFGGTQNGNAPFTLAEGTNGRVAGVTYNGNTSVPQVEIAEGTTLSAYTVGANTSGSGPRGLITDSRSGADFLNHLISLQDHLNANDSSAIASTDRANLAADEDNLLLHIADIGAVQARLESSSAMIDHRSASITSSVSNETDADLAQTLVKLSQTQTAYQAALKTGASVLQLSLLDYIR